MDKFNVLLTAEEIARGQLASDNSSNTVTTVGTAQIFLRNADLGVRQEDVDEEAYNQQLADIEQDVEEALADNLRTSVSPCGVSCQVIADNLTVVTIDFDVVPEKTSSEED